MTAMKYSPISTLADVDKLIAGAIAAAKTMKARVQAAAIGIMILAAKDGTDEETGKEYPELAIERANYLVEQVGQGIHGAGLIKFFVNKCGFKINEALKKEGFCDVAGPDWIRNHLEEAKATMWWEFSPKNPFKGFNLAQQIQQVIKQADNAVKVADGDEEKAKLVEVDRDMLEVLQHLVSGTPVSQENALRLVERLIPEEREAA